ncbi:hypothetical protein HanXRQr2_Chr17g0817591 [Helianthus annuus]|uniref:Uncharacterized protein n=1 Tax=Helianthus annuus TaxID=4232 RepID=A0A9K3GVM3_HELAN|nr:hypothetical protein HanXRQr2_Chr17g0817591 [Helianthus annuus]
MKNLKNYLKSCFLLISFEFDLLNRLSINRLVRINWYQSGLDPLMDAHEWNESLDRIISTIAEMIDLLKNESRRWATSPIFSLPLPSPAAASSPPTSALVPTLPQPVSATAPTTTTPSPVPSLAPPSVSAPEPPPALVALPTSALSSLDFVWSPLPLISPSTRISVPIKIQPLILPLSIQTNSDISSHNPYKPIFLPTLQQKSPRSRPTSLTLSHKFFNMDSIAKCHLISISWWYPSPGTSPSPSPSHGKCIHNNLVTTSNCFGLVSKEEVDKGEAEKREWRPPWRLILETTPSATVRVEWRPSWFTPSRILIFDLRTSRVRVGWIDMCLLLHVHASHDFHYSSCFVCLLLHVSK